MSSHLATLDEAFDHLGAQLAQQIDVSHLVIDLPQVIALHDASPAFFFQLGLASVLQPFLGERGTVAASPSVGKVAERVQAAYREALHMILLPELSR